jgi:hypothetical protein
VVSSMKMAPRYNLEIKMFVLEVVMHHFLWSIERKGIKLQVFCQSLCVCVIAELYPKFGVDAYCISFICQMPAPFVNFDAFSQTE